MKFIKMLEAFKKPTSEEIEKYRHNKLAEYNISMALIHAILENIIKDFYTYDSLLDMFDPDENHFIKLVKRYGYESILEAINNFKNHNLVNNNRIYKGEKAEKYIIKNNLERELENFIAASIFFDAMSDRFFDKILENIPDAQLENIENIILQFYLTEYWNNTI